MPSSHLILCQQSNSVINIYTCLVARSCSTPCDPMDCNPPGSSTHGILQARILEWVAMTFSRQTSQPGDRTHMSSVYLHWQGSSLPLVPPEKPLNYCCGLKYLCIPYGTMSKSEQMFAITQSILEISCAVFVFQ